MIQQAQPSRLILRPFQQEAVTAVVQAYQRGVLRQAIVLPTGSGKTVLATHIREQFPWMQCTFICHREELVRQTVEKFSMNNPGLRIRVVKAGEGRTAEELRGADVIVASAQTLARKDRLASFLRIRGTGGLVIADELHHYHDKNNWGEVVVALKPDLLVGMSATPRRGDGVSLQGLFDEVVYQQSLLWMVEHGYLARPVGLRIGTTTSLDGLATRQGDFAQGELEVRVNTSERNRLIALAWQKYASDRKSIAFATDVAHVHNLCTALEACGAKAAAIVGTTPTEERQSIYRRFRNGQLNVMVSCNVLLEGFDEPSVDCCILARPTQSESLYIQAVGRGLRKYPNKQDCLVLDVCDLTSKHSLQSIATLAGKEAVERQPVDRERYDLFAEVRQVSERRARIRAGAERAGDLLQSSTWAWTQAPSGTYVVQSLGEYICLVPTLDGTFWAIAAHTNPKKGWRQLFHQPTDIETAMSIGERHITASAITERDRAWRQKERSPQQQEMCRKYSIQIKPHMTRGQVADAITAAFADRHLARLHVRETLLKGV